MANLQSALEWAKQNPNDERAKKLLSAVANGKINSDMVQAKTIQKQQEEGTGGLGGALLGIGKGIASTVTGLGELALKGAEKIAPEGSKEAIRGGIQYGEELRKTTFSPKGTAEKIGFGGEQIGEFFTPGGLEKTGIKLAEYAPKIAKYLPEASRIIGEALKTGTISSAQEGDTKDLGLNALVSLGLSGIGKSASKTLKPIKKILSEKVPGRILNSIIKPGVNDFTFGKDPGKAVVKEGITGKSMNDLFNKIKSKKQDIGNQISSEISGIKDKTVNLSPIIGKIDEFISTATDQGEQALVSRLQAIKDGLTKSYKNVEGKLVETGNKAMKVSPIEAWDIKKKIGEAAKWTGQAFDKEANQARVSVYRGIADELENLSPKLKGLNKRYADLLTAQKAAERRIDVIQRLNKVGLGDITTLGAGGVAGGPVGAAVAYGAKKAIGSTAVQSNIAQLLSKLKPQERSIIEKILPSIQKIYLGTINNEK